MRFGPPESKKRGEGAYLKKQAAILQRTEAKRTRDRLQAELRRAKRAKRARVAKTREAIRRGRLRLRAAIARFRKEWREYVNQEVKARRARARAAWQHKLAVAAVGPSKRVAERKRAMDEFRAEQKAIRTWGKTERSAGGVKRAYARKAESDERVKNNLPAELRPVWAKMRHRIKTTARRKTRTEAFLEWCAENPAEVLRLQWGDDDQAKLEKELREAEQALRGVAKARRQAADIDWEFMPTG